MAGLDPLTVIGRLLVFGGILLAAIGALVLLGARLPGLGRLPGDFVWSRGNVRVYLPLATGLILSLALTILFSVIARLRR
jgi:hypothetical protein